MMYKVGDIIFSKRDFDLKLRSIVVSINSGDKFVIMDISQSYYELYYYERVIKNKMNSGFHFNMDSKDLVNFTDYNTYIRKEKLERLKMLSGRL